VIEARCFGRSEIVTQAGHILPTSELLFAVALYLCVRAGELVSRTELVELFWPHADEAKGRHSVRQLLYRLKEVGVTLDGDGELLSLSPARVRCDLADALRSDWIIEADEATIAAACDALPGLTRRFSERYGEWIDEIRARLETQFRRAALRVLSDAKAEGRWYDVEHWALMLLRTDPLNETAVLARAEGTAMLGSKAEAIEQLDRYLGELGPKTEQIGLPAKLLRRRITEQGERKTGGQTLPLVGREDEVRQLTEGLRGRATVRAQGFFVHGPAGIGKTRLLEECALIGELNGMTHIGFTLSARDIDQPNILLIALSQRLIGMRGSIGADPRAIGLINRIQGTAEGNANTTLTGSAVLSSHDLVWAAEQLLAATLAEMRVIITFDDIHYASPDDIALLCKTMTAQNPARLAWYLAARAFPAQDLVSGPPPYLSLLTAIHLPPLTQRDSATLTHQILDSMGRPVTDDTVEDIVTQATGNPLFLSELTRSATDKLKGARLPRTLQRIIGKRIAALTSAQLEVCRLVCVLNEDATLDNIKSLTSSHPKTLAHELIKLEAEGVLSTGRSMALVMHECWRLAIADDMSPLSRVILSLAAADHISSKPGAHTSPSILSAAARLYAAGHDTTRAFTNYLHAGRLLYERGLCHQALPLLSHAREYASDPEDHLGLSTLEACIAHAQADFPIAVELANAGLRLRFLPNAQSISNLTTLTAVLADASWKAGLPFQDALSRLEQLITSDNISSLAREHACFLGLRLAYNSHASKTAEHFLRWSAAQAGSMPHTPFAALTSLIHLAERGSTHDVIEACERFLRLDISSLPHQYSLLTKRYIGQSLRWAGEYPKSLSVAEMAFADAERCGMLDEAAMIALQIAFTELDLCKADKAHLWIEKASLNSSPSRSQERDIAIRHAKSRLYIQEFRWNEAFDLLSPQTDSILSDPTLRRRLAEGACLALAAAHGGHYVVSSHACDVVQSTLRADTPSLQTDFPVTALFRALITLNRGEEARHIMQQYCLRRKVSFQRPVAPYFVEIASGLRDTQTS